MLKGSGFHFDEIYTSVLTRAICTSNFILDGLKAHYIPVIKHWRLNEKNYGSLEVQVLIVRGKIKLKSMIDMEMRRLPTGEEALIFLHQN